jgi:hypothetical protein
MHDEATAAGRPSVATPNARLDLLPALAGGGRRTSNVEMGRVKAIKELSI